MNLHKIQTQNPDFKLAEIEGVLYEIQNKPNIPFEKLVGLTGIPSKSLKTLLSGMTSLVIDNRGSYNLQSQNIKYQKYEWGTFNLEDKDLEQKIIDIRKKYDLLPKREFDQFFATPKTTVQKALIIGQKGLDKETNIALVGDDDLVSVALALKYKNILKISVLEIDEQISTAISKIAKDYNLKIEVVRQDIRNKIMPHLYSTFDVVLIDPPYTETGVELFIDRSIDLLKTKKDFSGSYIFLNYGNSFKSPEKYLKIQKLFSKYNLLLEDSVNKFNEYAGAISIGSRSNLYVLKTTSQTESSGIKPANIYTFEVNEGKNFPLVENYEFKLLEVPKIILEKQGLLDKKCREFAGAHRLKIVGTTIKKFSAQPGLAPGFTLVYTLKNSSLSVHTWPEFSALHISLVTCAKLYSRGDLLANICDIFETNKVEISSF